jgi:N-acetylglutamate synthase-like GNAT family acetyltransferase
VKHGLLAAYDAQLRESAEVADMVDVHPIGSLVLAKPVPSRGFVTYRSLSGLSPAEVEGLITQAIDWFSADPQVTEFEWKTRDHDEPRNLGNLLTAHGLRAQERETVMAGLAEQLAGEDTVPEGVELHRAGDRGDVEGDTARVVAMQATIWGPIPEMAEMTLRRLASPYVDLWFAEADGEVVGAGRLDRVPGTDFAGLWGGAVRGDWRGRGIYRALTQARARTALASGARYLYADCTVMSRVILEGCGLIPITTTVPYIWRRYR